ncbi:uncharacterized protein LOC124338028 isoform X1 [Daphnia pulicaria]|uniref:uncharacterized protein LOC124338028 isoform X1 n=1 Tax=Daphnia pulicaria TaxID=35523 RepID=UPI001EEA1C79|nr:uncharacterized protein LOC124338028 isoform X1 [Daphnia pulicaria]
MWQNPARNIEIKARINDVKAIVNKVAQLCKTEAEVIDQTDTFFKTENGRLKLREFKNGTGELIYYERPDTDGPKLSNYSKSMVTDPTSLKAVLQMALGTNGIVKKTRMLSHFNQTRIHIDEVVGLGNFLELEVVLQDSQTPADGITTAQLLLEILGIPASDLLSGSYLDFLNLL